MRKGQEYRTTCNNTLPCAQVHRPPVARGRNSPFGIISQRPALQDHRKGFRVPRPLTPLRGGQPSWLTLVDRPRRCSACRPKCSDLPVLSPLACNRARSPFGRVRRMHASVCPWSLSSSRPCRNNGRPPR